MAPENVIGAAGNLLSRTNVSDTDLNQTTTCDALDRQKTFTVCPTTTTWGVDSQGNRSSTAGPTAKYPSAGYNSVNESLSDAYSQDGYPTTLSFGTDSHYTAALKFDAWGRLVQSRGNSATSVASSVYEYDAMGRLIATHNYDAGTDPATSPPLRSSTRDLYDGQNLIEERGGSGAANSGTVESQYVWSGAGPAGLILRDSNFDNNAATTNSSLTSAGLEQRLYAQQDAAGSVTSVTDVSGAVQERYSYDQDGQPLVLQQDWTRYSDVGGARPMASQVGWDYLYGDQRFVQLFKNSPSAGPSGLFVSARGWYNPHSGTELVPNNSALAAGQNAYDSTGGETGFAGWYDRNAGYIAAGSAIGIGATLTVATGGLALAYAPELLGLANGAIITAYGAATSPLGTYALGLAATGTVAGMIANPDFRDQVLSSTDPAHFAELPLAAGQFLFKNGPAGLQAAGAWAAEAGPIFASGFMRGVNAPIGAYYFGSIGGEGLAGGARIVNGVRAGFAEVAAENAAVARNA